MSNEEKHVEENEIPETPQAETVAEADANLNGTAESDALADEPVELTLEEQLAAAEHRAQEKNDDWMRALADLQNARRKFDENLARSRNHITIDVITDLLPVFDDLELAFANVPEAIAQDDWFSGLSAVHKKLDTVFEKLRIEKISSLGAQFDPELHNAIMREESDEHETDTIIKEYQSGYRLGDRVIRPAVVAVAH